MEGDEDVKREITKCEKYVSRVWKYVKCENYRPEAGWKYWKKWSLEVVNEVKVHATTAFLEKEDEDKLVEASLPTDKLAILRSKEFINFQCTSLR